MATQSNIIDTFYLVVSNEFDTSDSYFTAPNPTRETWSVGCVYQAGQHFPGVGRDSGYSRNKNFGTSRTLIFFELSPPSCLKGVISQGGARVRRFLHKATWVSGVRIGSSVIRIESLEFIWGIPKRCVFRIFATELVPLFLIRRSPTPEATPMSARNTLTFPDGFPHDVRRLSCASPFPNLTGTGFPLALFLSVIPWLPTSTDAFKMVTQSNIIDHLYSECFKRTNSRLLFFLF